MKHPIAALFVAVLPLACAATGESDCGRCHTKQVLSHPGTPMARALLKPEDNTVVSSPLTFSDGRWRYTITKDEYRVTDGKDTFSAPIRWAFGAGIAGQTYVYEYSGGLYESRVSYYERIRGLDLTLGAIGSKPESLEMAAGRRMTDQDIADCFGCHSTSTGGFSIATLTPGVQCAACHAGISEHQKLVAMLPRTLRKISTEEMSELCGRCHRTWEQISINGPKGIANVRFQPYRLTNSKCYDADDRRIRCTACHEPHSSLETRVEAYDAKCRACHAKNSGSSASAHICKAGIDRCAECHMPRYEIPGSHMIFSDHQIRIVRNRKEYPN